MSEEPRLMPGYFSGHTRRQRIFLLLLLAPTTLLAFAATVVPLGYAILTSLNDFPVGQPVTFVGLQNYQDLLGDLGFLNSVGTTLIYTVVATGAEFSLGMGLAILLKDEVPLQGILRSVLIIPMIIAPVVVGIVWRLLYSADVGLLNFALKLLTQQPISILSSPALALPAVILVDIWEWTPFMFLILLAGIHSLPSEPFEAAQIDGASPWEIFSHLTLPMLRPVIMVAVLIRGLDAFTVFDQIFVLTQGGPGTTTEVATLLIYKTAFRFSQIGYASSMAIALTFLLVALSGVVLQALREPSTRGLASETG